MEVSFKSMEIEEGKSVKIKGDCFGQDIIIRASLIQLAKIFGSDREVGKELRNNLVSEDYTTQHLPETQKFIEKFPDIETWDNEVELRYISVKDGDEGDLVVYGEDLVGWEDEGVAIYFPHELYKNTIGSKKFKVKMHSFGVVFDVDDK